tara:strand:- start:115 stop:489 length:375 start_codon:yes stop_codon:yes gene_type:complete
MISKRDQINYLVILLCIIILILTTIFKNDIEEVQVYGVILITFLIIVFTIYSLVYTKEEFVNSRTCHNRNKEYLDYKDKIFNRVNTLREIEEEDRQGIEYDDEMNKIIEMGHHNLDYSANGESF